MIISHIVAAAENDVIGTQGTLPWDIPEDMKFFKDKTKGHSIIMGRKTFESMGRPLPNRLNVVVTRQTNYAAPGIHIVPSIKEATTFCKNATSDFGNEIFIIGGGEIYKQSMDIVDIIYLTRIHKKIHGDTLYPKIDPSIFEEVERRERQSPVPFTFFTYKKRLN